jgi:hypothetical protein
VRPVSTGGFAEPFPITDPAILESNYASFRGLVDAAASALANGSPELAAIRAEAAAWFATWCHTGLFADGALEEVLRKAGERLQPPLAPHRTLWGDEPRRILHVTTWSFAMGGSSRLVWRWVKLDADRVHSVALTRQHSVPVPAELVRAVAATGGELVALDEGFGGVAGQVRHLRALAAKADLVVLHVETEDVIPALAFQSHSGPPVAIVNHADHAFWAGVGACDVVINLRQAGALLSGRRRGVSTERNLVLPTPLQSATSTVSREDARRHLGIPPDAILMLSVARPPKFVATSGLHFVELHDGILNAEHATYLWAIGPAADGVWETARRRFGGRVRALEATPDTELYLAAADIYVDSYPFTSVTSMLEAGLRGLPVVSFSPYDADSSVLAPNAPGLDGCVAMAHDIQEYNAVLTRLVRDEAFRRAVGCRTSTAISSQHTNGAWRRQLHSVYRDIARLGHINRYGGIAHTPLWDSEPDIHIPAVFGRPVDPDDHTVARLGVLPTHARLREWSRLRRDHGAPLTKLAPEVLRRILRRVLGPAA